MRKQEKMSQEMTRYEEKNSDEHSQKYDKISLHNYTKSIKLQSHKLHTFPIKQVMIAAIK